ncbi:hypothetical protein ABVT39_027268 [Epinephelus coioides]
MTISVSKRKQPDPDSGGDSAVCTHDRVTQSYKFIRGDRRCRTEAASTVQSKRPTSCVFVHGVLRILCRFIQSDISELGVKTAMQSK